MTLEIVPLIDFPKVKERIKQRHAKGFYKNHFQRVFVKPVGRSALRYSKCNNSEHFEKECLKVWRQVKKEWAKTVFNTNSWTQENLGTKESLSFSFVHKSLLKER